MEQRHTRGKILTSYRDVHGLSQTQLAEQFGENRGGILSKFESGERDLTDEMLFRVIDEFGLPWEKLISPEQLKQLKRWDAIRGLGANG